MRDGTSGVSGVMEGASSEACPEEWTLSVYADRELDAEETRGVEAHLIGCRGCREVVLALDEEAAMLRRALAVEETSAAMPAPATAAERLAWDVGGALAVGGAALAAIGWGLAFFVPSDLDWLNPLDAAALFTLFFDTAALLREEGPALYQLVVASATLLGAAFLLTTSFGILTRRLAPSRGLSGLLLATGLASGLALVAPPPATALDVFHRDETMRIEAGEVVESTAISMAETVEIEGTLRGDLVALGDRVVVRGVIDGNLVTGARRVEVEGRVTGSVLAFGDRVRIAGEVGGSVFSAAGQTTLEDDGRVNRDVVAAGDGLLISGEVGRDLVAWIEWLELRGAVGRDLRVHVEEADLHPAARIGRDLEIRHREEREHVVIDETTTVGGETRIAEATYEHHRFGERFRSRDFYVSLLLSLVAGCLAGLLVFRLAPWLLAEVDRSGPALARALGVGFVTVFAAPIALVLVGITIVGLPIAVAGFAAYGLCFYLAKIAVGAGVGLALVGAPASSGWRDFVWPLVAGLTLVTVATALPFVGPLLAFLVRLVGMGLVVLRIRERILAARA